MDDVQQFHYVWMLQLLQEFDLPHRGDVNTLAVFFKVSKFLDCYFAPKSVCFDQIGLVNLSESPFANFVDLVNIFEENSLIFGSASLNGVSWLH